MLTCEALILTTCFERSSSKAENNKSSWKIKTTKRCARSPAIYCIFVRKSQLFLLQIVVKQKYDYFSLILQEYVNLWQVDVTI